MICTASPKASEKIRNNLSQSFILETLSKSLPGEQLGIPLKHFLSFLLPCILVTVIVAHHVTSRCCCVAGCDCLSISLLISTPYSHHPLLKKKKKKQKLIYQNNSMSEQKFIFSLISSPIVSQFRTMNLKISLLLYWLLKILPYF